MYDNVLAFQGTFRTYQQRVLEEADQYIKDGKIHIVAAPGSGKTTLGIELIRRLGMPALILSPRIVIREQWLDRIREGFLTEPKKAEQILSNDITHPGMITSITYQTLYSSMTRFKGAQLEDEAGEDAEDTEQDVDYSDFELLQVVKKAGVKVICLDECHHLRSEWWSALETFMKEMDREHIKVISLTATPPYDSTLAQWERYINLCGPIDEEIIVPELVRENSLCPHQDYVYFNFPTKEENKKVKEFRKKAKEMLSQRMKDERFAEIIASHKALQNCNAYADQMLEEPPYLSALLIFCAQKKIPFDRKWLKLLGVSHLPSMDEQWMEILLQKLLFDKKEDFSCTEEERSHLMTELRTNHFITRQKVGLLFNENLQKLMTNSHGKIESIKTIVGEELSAAGSDLRMLILTDYIRKEYLSVIGNTDAEVNDMGVLPLFEQLRRHIDSRYKLGVLCGSVVILPSKAVFRLEAALKERFGRTDMLNIKEMQDTMGVMLGYAKVVIQGKRYDTTKLVTELFEAGEIHVLIGTKALLGEGWDSPGINSLILASFVGSYVLSNQMRGRAIRMMKGVADKTSNIWHLVCIENQEEDKELRYMGIREEYLSEDFATLQRRMKGFIGVSYDGKSIENGMERLDIIKGPYNKKHIEEINQDMIRKAKDREALRNQWEHAIVAFDKMEVVDECKVPAHQIKERGIFFNVIGWLVMDIISIVLVTMIRINVSAMRAENLLHRILYLILIILLVEKFFNLAWRGIKYLTPLRNLGQMGEGIQKALEQKGVLSSQTKVVTEDVDENVYRVYLKGGTTREKELFTDCIEEFLGIVDNQRYLLHRKHSAVGMMRYFCVPELFAKSKKEAVDFTACMKKSIGKYELIYTRNEAGRKLLLRARTRAYANRAARVWDKMNNRKRKVKNALQ